MTFTSRSKLHLLSFFLLLFVILSGFIINGVAQRNTTHAAQISNPLTVYVGSQDRIVYALTARNGQLRWGSTTRGTVFSSPTVVGNTVYIGSEDHNVYAFNGLCTKTPSNRPLFVQGAILHKKSVLFPVHTWMKSPRKYYGTIPCIAVHW